MHTQLANTATGKNILSRIGAATAAKVNVSALHAATAANNHSETETIFCEILQRSSGVSQHPVQSSDNSAKSQVMNGIL